MLAAWTAVACGLLTTCAGGCDRNHLRRRAPVMAGRGEGQREDQQFHAHLMDRSAQLAVSLGLLAMEASSGT
jgi:hypothetical protein